MQMGMYICLKALLRLLELTIPDFWKQKGELYVNKRRIYSFIYRA